jgi:hypothetical protein
LGGLKGNGGTFEFLVYTAPVDILLKKRRGVGGIGEGKLVVLVHEKLPREVLQPKRFKVTGISTPLVLHRKRLL